MKLFTLTALATVIAAPLFAEPACEATDQATPVWEAIKAFEAEGGNVIAFKINGGGCYEIYGKLGEDKMEVFFDPATGAELDRIKA
jgi:hypothetical protein